MQVSRLYTIEPDADNNTVLYQTIELLKQAINDWPTEIKTIEAFLDNVEDHLHCSEITIDIIDRGVSGIGSTKEFWKMEALSSIQELMNINEGKTLEAILKNLVLYLE